MPFWSLVNKSLGHYLFLSRVISAAEHSGPVLIGLRHFGLWSFLPQVISTPSHFAPFLFWSRTCHFDLVSLRPRTFRYLVVSMPYHFGSWSSRPRISLLVNVVVKTWFRLCYVQCTQFRCMVWFTLGLCSGFGSMFGDGFYYALGLFQKKKKKKLGEILQSI